MIFALLAIPILIGLFGLIFGKGKITWQEFAIQEGAVVLLVGAAYGVALCGKTTDTEIWNGVIASKTKDAIHCCHSYSCHCRQVCSGRGKNRSCHEECDTCYRHALDYSYNSSTSNNETAFSDTCNSPFSGSPARWDAIKVGEPTSIEHYYTNYVMANPDTIIKRTGAKERYQSIIPTYPRVYDYYRANHVLFNGINYTNISEINTKLAEINAKLGAIKKVNIILLVTNQNEHAYIEAIREAWIGGKKNDVIVVIGAPGFPEISWAGVISWTKNEDIKINIRDKLIDLHTFDSNKVLDIISQEVQNGFQHRSWNEFDYLKSTIEPSNTVLIIIFILGILFSIGLEIYFWQNDPFNARAPKNRIRNIGFRSM